MMATTQSKAYLLTQVLTASRVEVIVYLYEGAIGYLHRALTALQEGRRDDARQAIDRAVNIIIEMSGNLNYAADGRLALRLDCIYNYLIETLTLAAAHEDMEALQACESILSILHDAWQQAASVEEADSRKNYRQLQVSA